jgi:hypothetical protein
MGKPRIAWSFSYFLLSQSSTMEESHVPFCDFCPPLCGQMFCFASVQNAQKYFS